jgi:hypothetical protein
LTLTGVFLAKKEAGGKGPSFFVMEACKGGLLKCGLLSCKLLQIPAAIYLNLYSSNNHHSKNYA